MPQKILPKVDMDIIMELSIGTKNSVIAKKYNVSPSYVSKIKRGKKNIEVPINPLKNGIKLDTIEYVQKQIRIRTQELLIYEEILKNIKENNYARR